MATVTHSKSLLNMVFVALSLVVVGGAALVMTNNLPTSFKSGASNVNETRNGVLVKNGVSPEFKTKCLITQPRTALSETAGVDGGVGQNVGIGNRLGIGKRPAPTPVPPQKDDNKGRRPAPTSQPPVISYSYGLIDGEHCTPLIINASMADPFVGKKVTVTGTDQKGIFYVTTIKAFANCQQQCPGKDNVLRNCNPPEKDGTSADSLCNAAGRIEGCGTQKFCCPKPGAAWTTDLSKCQPVPTPISKCIQQCPGKDNVLRNCNPPEADGTSADSLCNAAGRIEACGTQSFCCPSVGGKWTTDMTACSPKPQPPIRAF